MRSKQEIEAEVERDLPGGDTRAPFEVKGLKNQALIIEVLLDIRALLMPKKTSFPPSAPPPPVFDKGRTT